MRGVLVVALTLVFGMAPADASWPGRNGVLLAASQYCPTAHEGGCDGSSHGVLTPFRLGGKVLGGAQFDGGLSGSAAWSPDGRLVALDTVGADYRIEIVPAQALFGTTTSTDPAGRVLPGTALASDPTFSPDGDRLAYVGREGNAKRLHVRDLGSGVDRALVVPAEDPKWGTGGLIAFTRKTGANRSDLFLVTPDGTGERRLTFRGGEHADWSPDGRRLVYQRGSGGLYVIDISGGKPRRLTRNGYAAVWAPDGRWIAFNRTVPTPKTCQPEFGFDTCSTTWTYIARPDATGLRVLRRPRRRSQRVGTPLVLGGLVDWRPIPRAL